MKPTWWTRWTSDWAQAALRRALAQLTDDQIILQTPGRLEVFGQAGGLTATVTVHDPRFFSRVLTGGSLGAAESWMDGDWTCDDLVALVRIFLRHPAAMQRLDTSFSWGKRLLAAVQHLWRRNTRRGARRNIQEHYDLGNDFFALMLDETLSYSCAIFPRPEASLGEASRAKLERVCRKLELGPSDHLLEIGTGWGGLALYAAQRYGCRVTTTTISPAQHRLAQQRVAEAGLADRVQVLLADYRDLTGQYDKLVSIEMIEAVGYEYFETFFRQCARLLKPQGRMLLQAIVIRDPLFAAHRHSVDFIRTYVFPGGCLPSITALGQAMQRACDWRLLHLEEMSAHYVRTLQAWRQRFTAQRDQVRALGYSERLIRQWEYYLCYCEAAFAQRQVNVVQMLLAPPQCLVDPLTLRLPRVHDAAPAHPPAPVDDDFSDATVSPYAGVSVR
jgi:cyclopropane-fatty-acyl-phospholipid synthase